MEIGEYIDFVLKIHTFGNRQNSREVSVTKTPLSTEVYTASRSSDAA